VSWFGSTRLSQGLPRSRRSFAMIDRHRESERRTNTFSQILPPFIPAIKASRPAGRCRLRNGMAAR
jgi:hypothetical protein